MAKVTVYRAEFYDVQNDGMVRSNRWFTRDGAEFAKGRLLEDTGVEIDESEMENEYWTARNFDPHRTLGWQQQVR